MLVVERRVGIGPEHIISADPQQLQYHGEFGVLVLVVVQKEVSQTANNAIDHSHSKIQDQHEQAESGSLGAQHRGMQEVSEQLLDFVTVAVVDGQQGGKEGANQQDGVDLQQGVAKFVPDFHHLHQISRILADILQQVSWHGARQ